MIDLLGSCEWKHWHNVGSATIGAFEVFEITDNEVIGGETFRKGQQPTSGSAPSTP